MRKIIIPPIQSIIRILFGYVWLLQRIKEIIDKFRALSIINGSAINVIRVLRAFTISLLLALYSPFFISCSRLHLGNVSSGPGKSFGMRHGKINVEFARNTFISNVSA